MFTPPRFTFFTFKPMVGHVSRGCPSASTLRSVVLPLQPQPQCHRTLSSDQRHWTATQTPKAVHILRIF
jgi:hypothetical protein